MGIPAIIRFGRAICGDLHEAERREWWLANGLGGYAAGTIAGSLTRRYHGLLIAPVDPPLGRRLIWAKADAELIDGEQAGLSALIAGAAARSARRVMSTSNRFISTAAFRSGSSPSDSRVSRRGSGSNPI